MIHGRHTRGHIVIGAVLGAAMVVGSIRIINSVTADLERDLARIDRNHGANMICIHSDDRDCIPARTDLHAPRGTQDVRGTAMCIVLDSIGATNSLLEEYGCP